MPAMPSVGQGTVRLALAGFWVWLLLRWSNDWAGGLLVPQQEPFVSPEAVVNVGTGTVFAGVFEAFGFAIQHLPGLGGAMWLTLLLTVISIALGFLLAVPLSVARVYGRLTAYVSYGYTELLRGTPLLAQLFVLYYGLNLSASVPPLLDGVFPNRAVWVAIVGFTFNSAAYQAEYIRAAIESVDTGQLVAGRAVGLQKLAAIRLIVLPQALRYAIPGWSNELVYLVKYSSLAAFITVPELFDTANEIASNNFRFTAMFTLTALLYLGLVVSASELMGWVEKETAIPGVGGAEGR